MVTRFKKGFTLVELLVVISIIGLLSTIAVVSLGGSRVKARNTKRDADMRQILTALQLYQEINGCLPITNGSTCAGNGEYSEWNAGAWDYSSQGGFLTFLQTSGVMQKVPVDPVNNMTGDGTPAGTYGYFYFCYTDNPQGPTLGYRRESDGLIVLTLLRTTNGDFVCK